MFFVFEILLLIIELNFDLLLSSGESSLTTKIFESLFFFHFELGLVNMGDPLLVLLKALSLLLQLLHEDFTLVHSKKGDGFF